MYRVIIWLNEVGGVVVSSVAHVSRRGRNLLIRSFVQDSCIAPQEGRVDGRGEESEKWVKTEKNRAISCLKQFLN